MTDLDSATPAELVATSARLNSALRRLGSGWTVFVKAQRIPAQDYPASKFPDPVSALVDAERCAQFEEAGAHFESAYFLTLIWMPPADNANCAEGWLLENAPDHRTKPQDVISGFVGRPDRLIDLLDGFMPEIAWHLRCRDPDLPAFDRFDPAPARPRPGGTDASGRSAGR